MSYLIDFLEGLWEISLEAAPFLIIGFLAAALLHRYVPSSWLIRMLGRGRWKPTVSAAVLGIPLPLCSCSVVPTALAIQKKGAPKGATLSFFIATPETGVDSILLTYGMLGPVMAVVRPLAAGLSAIGAGWLLEALSPSRSEPVLSTEPGQEEPTTCCSSSSCCGGEKEVPPTGSCCDSVKGSEHSKSRWNLSEEFSGLRHSFFLLFDEIAIWVALGLVLSALAAVFIPDSLFDSSWGNGWKGMMVAILVGLPIYVCATASTPLAAVMVGKGFSIGAALVFLLVGPATNLGTMTVVWKILGKRAVASYLISIIAVAVCFGWLLDTVFPGLGSAWVEIGGGHSEKGGIATIVCAMVLWMLLLGRILSPLLKRVEQKCLGSKRANR